MFKLLMSGCESSVDSTALSVSGGFVFFTYVCLMTGIKVCMADDTWEDRLLIASYLESFPQFILSGQAENAMEAKALLMEHKPDVLITDVQMPGMTGLQMVATLPVKPLVVVMSSYPEFAAGSFDIEALDFLSKPVSFERFSKTIRKIEDWMRIHQEQAANQISASPNDSSHFVIKTNSEYVKVAFEDVLYAEAMVDFSIIRTTIEKKMVVLVNLKNLMQQWPNPPFKRCHRSFIVNMNRVKKMGEGQLSLDDGTTLSVGREYEKEISDFFVGNLLIKRKS